MVHIGENSPEQVAYKLMQHIAYAEKVKLEGAGANATREWIIKTYMMCRVAVDGVANAQYVLEIGQ
jgi:hypothetical protein